MGNGRSTSSGRAGAAQRSATSVHECLHEHSKEFDKPEVLKVTDEVYLCLGFGLANSCLILGDSGAVLIDAMESVAAARAVREAIDPLLDGRPISAIVYTHNHADHCHGTAALVEADGSTQIWSHEQCAYYMDRVLTATGEVTYRRAMRMFGVLLDPRDFENSGIGPFLHTKEDVGPDIRFPTHTFADSAELSAGGVQLRLLHCPGETNDQLCAWHEPSRTLFGADNIYKALPNVYTIRGTPSRDAMQWVRSLDRMIALDADLLVLGHTRPVEGRLEIRRLLTCYRDAIQFTHDQTLRLMNEGLPVEDIAHLVRLPPQLAAHPHLQEFYGMTEWNVRAIFSHYLGWFGGDPATLRPLRPRARAQRLRALAGGLPALRQAAARAVEQAQAAEDDLDARRDHAQWALELADAALESEAKVDGPEAKCRPGKGSAKDLALRVQALRLLGSVQPSANGRNYYLTCALEAEGMQIAPGKRRVEGAVETAKDMFAILSQLSLRYVPERAGFQRAFRAAFAFPDTGEEVGLELRNGVCLVSREAPPGDLDLQVRVDAATWRQIVAKKRSAKMAAAKGDLACPKGGLLLLNRLMSWFNRPK